MEKSCSTCKYFVEASIYARCSNPNLAGRDRVRGVTKPLLIPMGESGKKAIEICDAEQLHEWKIPVKKWWFF